ncbi:MAG: hypothetical protein GY772_23300 [bacterium]|nr:hypothetical protein [bacterium]
MTDADTVPMTRAEWLLMKIDKCYALQHVAHDNLPKADPRLAVSEQALEELVVELKRLERVVRPLLYSTDVVPLDAHDQATAKRDDGFGVKED